MNNKNLAYRADIDGLRAIAVLSVIINHVRHAWLPGGFVGVDIFFVISGYLITSIIYREMGKQEFTFARFYTRRIKRILPVFFVVLFAVLTVGIVMMVAPDLKHLAKSARYATFFASNFFLSQATGYFDPNALETPLLHTWSLAIEEQYYLLWPWMLILFTRLEKRWLLPISTLLCVVSFGLASYWVSQPGRWPTLAFYHIPTRFGELLIGSILALHPTTPRYPQLASIAGTLLLLASFLFINDASPFPGYNALWPCLGAALLIYAGSGTKTTIAGKFLQSKPVVFIGLLSYSLYLWHWPILSFMRYYTMEERLEMPWIISAAGLTALLSWLSWKFIEQPTRKKKFSFKKAAQLYFIVPTFIMLLVTFAIKKTDGYLLTAKHPDWNNIELKSGQCIGKLGNDCRIGSHDVRPSVLIFGDSHATHFSVLFDELAKMHHRSADMISSSACPFVESLSADNPYCAKSIAMVKERLPHFDTIIISMRWEKRFGLGSENKPGDRAHEKAISDYIVSLAESGKQVYLVAQAVKYQHDVLRSFHLDKDNNPVDEHYLEGNAHLKALADKSPNLHYVDFNNVIASWKNGIANGQPLYLDDDHINRVGQARLLEAIHNDDHLPL